MNMLPKEIWNKIFIQPALRERLNCMLVCRSWWSLIDEYSLLYDVEIVDSFDRFNRFMDMVSRSPHRAAQVEKLILRNTVGFDFDQRSLCNTFHNARLIEMTHSQSNMDNFTHFNKPFDMTHAKTKVETLIDSLYCNLTLQLLTSDLCGALHTLVLEFPGDEGDTRGQAIVAQMVNLPVLRSLTLARLKIDIHGLDTLHQNVPSIQEFKLDLVCILDSKAPSDIVPAASLTSLGIHIDWVANLGTHIQLYKFMTKKYINVTRTKYRDGSLVQYDTNEMVGLYSEAFLGFLQLIGPTTDSLTMFNLPPGTNVFGPLDATESRLERFEFYKCEDRSFLEDFSHSNQYKYVKTLNFRDTIVDPPSLLQGIPALTSLTLMGLRTVVDLSEYLNALPETSSIQSLSIYCNSPSDELGTLLSEKAPNLMKLEFTVPVLKHIKITLYRGHPLQTIRFRTHIRSLGHVFIFSHLDQANYYFCGGGNSSALWNITLTTKEAMKCLPWLTFTAPHKFKLDIRSGSIKLSREPE